ncbi:hypothetical protein [Defluviimonas sp. SAOS-178_SWC]|uniref:hypothetical protein n=1 Tax=Defluviimonas sp. SAOS-178_SWC TaxID=3121287 RepID=UPI0032218B79
MFRMKMPVDYWQSAVVFTAMMAEAQMVIAMRMMGGIGVWNLGPDEHMRMVAEKAGAASDAGHAVSRALWRGAGPGATTLAALKPIRKRTRSNVTRLHRKGPAGKGRYKP